ncbi:MAG: hypothetical protein OXU74_11355 [Gemmatimonadota bacterium]|nr:hypothetical protein [Gemmatimonadota bacterium]
MPIDQELLDILVCPENRTPVSMADAGVLDRLNAAIESRAVENLGGDAVTEPVTEALVREDGRILYAIREGIPVMLIDESIDLSKL